MRRILLGFIALVFMASNSWATVGWNKSIPATSENPQAISPDVIENNTALDLMLQNYRDGYVTITLSSTSLITIGSGGVMLQNSGGSVRLMVDNSGTSSLAPTNIDTGSISPSSTYYIYAYASSTTATTFSVIFSASSTSPTGITYYHRLGSFTTDGSSNFISVASDISPFPLSVYNYSSSSSAFTQVLSGGSGSVKIAYGDISVGTNTTVTITNLPFTSSSTYSISVSESSNPGITQPLQTSYVSGSSFSIYNANVTYGRTISWIAIGY